MADVTITQVADGTRTSVYHIAIRGDAAGELKREVLITPDNKQTRLIVEKIKYELLGFDAVLGFDFGGSEPETIWVLSEGGANADLDFSYFGGLKDRSQLDSRGKIVITTNGLDANTDVGTIILHVTKATYANVA